MAKDVQALQEIAALPEVKAALRARHNTRIGQELKADLPEIK